MSTIQYTGTSHQTCTATNRYIPQWKINEVLYEANIRINYLSFHSSECPSLLIVRQHLVGLVFISYSIQFAILKRYHIVSNIRSAKVTGVVLVIFYTCFTHKNMTHSRKYYPRPLFMSLIPQQAIVYYISSGWNF